MSNRFNPLPVVRGAMAPIQYIIATVLLDFLRLLDSLIKTAPDGVLLSTW